MPISLQKVDKFLPGTENGKKRYIPFGRKKRVYITL